MHRSFAGVVATALAGLVGCTQGTPGGPGTTDKGAAAPAYGQADDTFTLSVPWTSSSLQQGQKTEAVIGIRRATNFDEDVSIVFADVPKGVTVEPARPVIKHGDKEAKITFQAAEDAPLGEFVVQVTGHPAKGGDAHVGFKLAVAAKDSFTLGVTPSSTSLRQGEKKTVAIGIKRDKSFDQDVSLTFGELPAGVTLEPAAPVIRRGASDAQLTLTGAEDAALGNFVVRVTGRSAEGIDVTSDLKLDVVQK